MRFGDPDGLHQKACRYDPASQDGLAETRLVKLPRVVLEPKVHKPILGTIV